MASPNVSCVALLLCAVLGLAHAFLTQPKDEFTEGLFEGDILLTEEQRVMMEQRNAIPNLAKRWPGYQTGDVDIPFRYGDSVINQANIELGMVEFRKHTCLTFTEVAEGHDQPHMVISNSDSGCYSYVGRIPISYFPDGQPIKYTPGCARTLGTVLHEICHALGIQHEQSRSDRDEHVEIQFQNIKDGRSGNFEKRDTNNYNTVYDYLSMMHYGNSGFSKNGEYTIVTLNPLVQTVIGSRVGFSFMNKRLVNLMHGCINKWLSACGKAEEPCQNQGYTGKNCACVCPVGTSGSECETQSKPYAEAAVQEVQPYSEVVRTDGVLQSPNYPSGRTKGAGFVKVLKAPECHTIKYVFSDFHLRQYDNCLTEYLIVTSDLRQSTTKLCGDAITAGHVEESEGDTLIFVYQSHSTYASTYRGFNGTIEYVPIAGCDPTGETTTTPELTTMTTDATTTTPETITTTTESITTTPEIITTTPEATTTTTDSITTTTESPTTAHPTRPPTSPPGIYVINSGDNITMSLQQESAAPCGFDSSGAHSPNYPDGEYVKGQKCNFWLGTSEPRFVTVKATDVSLPDKDNFLITSVYKQNLRLRKREEGSATTLLSSYIKIFFNARAKNSGDGFLLEFDVLNNDCQQLIIMEPGSQGIIAFDNYEPGTLCQYWIKTDSGYGVKMTFSSFDVGSGHPNCVDDYVLFSMTGDRRYIKSRRLFCGLKTPRTVRSKSNELTMIFNGLVSKSGAGFRAVYSTYKL